MDSYLIIENIKNLKIQGAENIAQKGVLALYYYILSEKDIEKIKIFIIKLSKSRITEPTLRNAVKNLLLKSGLDDFVDFVFNNLTKDEIIYKKSIIIDIERIKLNYQGIQDHFKTVNNKINNNVLNFFEDYYRHKKIIKIYTHCHSNTVALSIINLKNKLKDKKIIVYNTETRPLYQGRITAFQLVENNIEVHHFVDSAMMMCIKQCDIVMLGCDAIQKNGDVINKIGSGMISYIAKELNKPLAIITDSWKEDPLTNKNDEIIEERDIKEIFDENYEKEAKKRNLYILVDNTKVIVEHEKDNDTKKGQLFIHNYAFEKIPKSNVFVLITDSYIKII